MKAFLIATALAIASMATAMPAPEPKGSNKATFCPVSLPGGHYEAGPSLFPGNVIKGINAKYSKYDQESWGQHVLSECEKEPACTSSLGFAGMFARQSRGPAA